MAPLFLWVYGWVGLAVVSAFVGPAWHFLDPFSTLHDARRLAAATARRRELDPGRLPGAARVAGRRASCSSAFVWLELVDAGGGVTTLFVVRRRLYAFTLAMMAQFGRDTWRANGEVFTVWYRLLGRLAALGARRRGRAGPAPPVRGRAARGRLVDGPMPPSPRSASGRSCSTACRRRSRSSTCSGRRGRRRDAAAVRAGSGCSSWRRCC